VTEQTSSGSCFPVRTSRRSRVVAEVNVGQLVPSNVPDELGRHSIDLVSFEGDLSQLRYSNEQIVWQARQQVFSHVELLETHEATQIVACHNFKPTFLDAQCDQVREDVCESSREVLNFLLRQINRLNTRMVFPGLVLT
jgi:hypothetical protein